MVAYSSIATIATLGLLNAVSVQAAGTVVVAIDYDANTCGGSPTKFAATSFPNVNACDSALGCSNRTASICNEGTDVDAALAKAFREKSISGKYFFAEIFTNSACTEPYTFGGVSVPPSGQFAREQCLADDNGATKTTADKLYRCTTTNCAADSCTELVVDACTNFGGVGGVYFKTSLKTIATSSSMKTAATIGSFALVALAGIANFL